MLDLSNCKCPDLIDVMEGSPYRKKHYRKNARFYCLKKETYFNNPLECCMDCDFFQKVYDDICREFGLENG